MFKVLVGTASVIVIVAGCVYVWGAWTDWRAGVARQNGRNAAILELFKFANAQPGEEQKVRDYCKFLDETQDASLRANDLYPSLTRNCRALGYL